MSGPALRPSQRVGIVGFISPVSQAAGTVTSGWMDATTFHNFLVALKTGVLGAAATVDAKLQQATDNAGTGAKDVTGKAITQLVKASNDNNQVTIDLKQEDLDFNNGFKWFRVSVTVGAAASLVDATVLGFDPRYGFGTDNDLASVVQNA
ncbi:hypothetical protein LUI11_15335 [Bradyrhizobium diazoefficiens]|uniref:Uncharacterized protein n=2 Tax=Bradyrhizobium diazoefficiens TaxID=1355477 RepID=A0A809YPB1_9BRAD|nr:hypothetical protein [Bradyrhizobium diazoefficiens]APO53464.1 hypothetical protein BD122_24365 [Bradyrhizobium diazoefficiens]KGJ70007.1 hypothetical protein BJA5080_04227 [Bradyrhizobium diazoefficiens SEMIA 5080]KOY09353.1 hypothetical protein AF336_15375 [Bradyrhizobium diazoefficiens]MCD9294951.1 hypothetical protein [Bradyrhizobium diazoefficiens]MCD9813450.1 hypothetical protein [Bradyrhizobium diazoefficiens]